MEVSEVTLIGGREGEPTTCMISPLSGRKRRGTVPATYVKASASIHRNILQQLEKMQLIEADSENG